MSVASASADRKKLVSPSSERKVLSDPALTAWKNTCHPKQWIVVNGCSQISRARITPTMPHLDRLAGDVQLLWITPLPYNSSTYVRIVNPWSKTFVEDRFDAESVDKFREAANAKRPQTEQRGALKLSSFFSGGAAAGLPSRFFPGKRPEIHYTVRCCVTSASGQPALIRLAALRIIPPRKIGGRRHVMRVPGVVAARRLRA